MLPVNTIDILKNLSKNELKRLGDFIYSPYFNSKESIHELYNEVVKNHPDFKPEKFDYEKIYKKIYGEENYKKQTIKNLYSQFGALLKKFIAHERIEANQADFNKALLSGLTDKKCFELSNKIISVLKKEKDKLVLTEDEQFFYTYYLESAYSDNLSSLDFSNLDIVHQQYNAISNNLIFYFLDVFFFFTIQDAVLTKAYKVKKDMDVIKKNFLKSFNGDEFFKNENDKYYPASLKIRYLAYMYSENEITEDEFKKFEELIIQNIDGFTAQFKIYCWAILERTILLKLIPKDKKYYEDAFRINNYFFNLKIFPNNFISIIPKSIIRDSISVAMVLKKFEWAENFIYYSYSYMNEDTREDEMNYCMGRLSFQRKKYEESIGYLSKVKFQQIDEKINVRFYYLMNYIELKSYQSALSMLNSTRQFYLESKELPEMFAVLIESSIKFFREIIKAEENNKKVDFAILKEAENAGRYYQKQYIISKLKTLV